MEPPGKIIEEKYSTGKEETPVIDSSADNLPHFATALIENIGDAVVVTDTDYRITGWNKGAEQLYGYRKEEAIGKTAHETIPTEFLKENDKQGWQDALDSVGCWKGEVIQKNRNGKRINILASIAYVKNEIGEPIGAVSINTDISERKRIEKDLKSTKEQLELTFRNATSAIELWSKNGELVFANEAAAKMYGFASTDEIIKEKNLRAITKKAFDTYEICDDAGERFNVENSPLSITLKTKAPAEAIVVGINKEDDSSIFVLSKSSPLFDEQGSLLMVLITNTDITQQKSAEEKIRQNEEHFRTLANSISQLAWMANADGWVYWYNQRWYDYTGTTLEQMEGHGWVRVHHPDHVERIVALSKEAWHTDEPFEITFPLRRKDGIYRWFLTRVYPIKNEEGKVMEWIGTNTDIDDYKKAMELKDEFMSMASHELKTPVTSLKGFTQILHMRFKKEGNTNATYLLSRMDKQIDKLTQLVVDLLDVTKIENGQIQFVMEEFNFNDLVVEIVEEMEKTTETHQIVVELSETKIINGDRARIGQVIMNLISNAIKYSRKAKEIIVSSYGEPGKIILSVQDFGIGIPEPELANVFDRFFRVLGENRETYPGLGLGLFIVAQIIERHNGTVSVKSVEGKGSTFSFTLPAVT